MKKSIYMAAAALLLGVQGIAAQDSEEPKLEIKPTGRILLDGALYASPQKELFPDGVAIPDARLGVKMKYGKWSAKIDVGFAYNKVGLKDLYFQYNFKDNSFLRLGSFIHQYGLQSATSSSMKPTMEEPVSNAVFNDSRQIGLMYEYANDKFLATASMHAEPKSTTVILNPSQFTKEGYGFRSRLVYHPICETGKVAQIGFSGGFATPQNVNDATTPHNSFQFKSNFPTRVAQVTALDATVDHAKNLWKFTPELLLNYGPVALEAQYYFIQVNRRQIRIDGVPEVAIPKLKPFRGQGAYCTLRGLLIGDSYSYATMDGGLATPKPGSLECVLDYNYTSLTDSKASVYGGRMNDFSVTFNYYINKYMIARLHYSYTHTWDTNFAGPRDLNGFMARLQVIF
ncbi:MAG: porin [Prevotella sp.]|nr:porin [Bacteroides sp.]MCM1366817.1 porin [Prevotella sp.]MCM1437398.1 porin [Prevotella sp.]